MTDTPEDRLRAAGAIVEHFSPGEPGAVDLSEVRRRKRGDNEPAPPGPLIDTSEDALATEFTARYGETWRFVSVWGLWLKWTGNRWEKDLTREAADNARAVCRAASVNATTPSEAKRILSDKTKNAVLSFAQADRQHAATTDQWDQDLWLLNTPAGIVDLRVKAPPRVHDPKRHMTKITGTTPRRVECPTWLAFLDRVTGGDLELQAFLQRVAGYCLTGSTRDHALFFFYGTGGNGKGVFLNTLTSIFGDYATTAPMETFTASTSDRHPADLAMLRGARLVTAQETEEGRQWAESKIKSLTGGDPITARFMRQDFFTFTPQFKLLIAGNHKPGLRNVDEAMRRRFHLVPFEVTIPPEERDPDLPDKLRAEWPGILVWAIDGCREWLANGLAPPPAVTNATAEYLHAEDSFADWMEEALTPVRGEFESTADLYASWSAWAAKAGEAPGSKKRFSQNMTSRGVEAGQHGHARSRGFFGFRLNRPDYTEDPRLGE